jgi:hypothetical protein
LNAGKAVRQAIRSRLNHSLNYLEQNAGRILDHEWNARKQLNTTLTNFNPGSLPFQPNKKAQGRYIAPKGQKQNHYATICPIRLEKAL